MLFYNNHYLSNLENRLLQSNLYRSCGISEVVDYHVQEKFSHFELVSKILNRAKTELIEAI